MFSPRLKKLNATNLTVTVNGGWDSRRVGELGTLAINEFLGGASVQVCKGGFLKM